MRLVPVPAGGEDGQRDRQDGRRIPDLPAEPQHVGMVDPHPRADPEERDGLEEGAFHEEGAEVEGGQQEQGQPGRLLDDEIERRREHRRRDQVPQVPQRIIGRTGDEPEQRALLDAVHHIRRRGDAGQPEQPGDRQDDQDIEQVPKKMRNQERMRTPFPFVHEPAFAGLSFLQVAEEQESRQDEEPAHRNRAEVPGDQLCREMEYVRAVQRPPHRRQVRADRVLEEHQDDQREAHGLDEFRLAGVEFGHGEGFRN